MNQAMSHLANKSVLQGDTYNRLLEQGSHQLKKKKEKKVHWRKVKVQVKTASH